MTTQLRYENDDGQGLFTNRTTVMANFEEWIKMATDNKINSSNSWNFALIDYFYDLNVLRDSENNINFQKASATLDGCVKIYSSRVDSVSNETGKLLSGLAQRKDTSKKNSKGSGEAGTDGDGNSENLDENNNDNDNSIQIDPLTGLPISNSSDMDTARRRIHNRILETTLVEFDTLRMKELDQELNIDPLFKKALVDFDEGGARSLLLNSLNVDESVRVIFDAAIKDKKSTNEEEEEEDHDEPMEQIDKSSLISQSSVHDNEKNNTFLDENTKDSSFIVDDEVLALGIDFIKFDKLATSEISSSIQQLRNVVEDISKAKTFVSNVNNNFDNFLTEQELQETVPDGFDGMDNNVDYYNDDNDDLGNNNDDDDDVENIMSSNLEPMHSIREKDLMAYFDDNLNKNWRGREHWKVRNFRKKILPASEIDEENEIKLKGTNGTPEAIPTTTTTKKKKNTFKVDFFNLDDDLEETIFITSKKKATIEMPQRLRVNDKHYLLPDDFHFSTEKITKLFIKPGQKMSLFNRSKKHSKNNSSYTQHDTLNSGFDHENTNNDNEPEIADQEFWADTYKRKEEEDKRDQNEDDSEVRGTELQNPFEDDDGGIDFNQAFDDAEMNDDDNVTDQPIQDDYIKKDEEVNGMPLKVTYSRVSKKVDVRRLKNNVWKSIKTLVSDKQENLEGKEIEEQIIVLSFKDIANEIVKMYPKEIMKDISTSFCFICLLHLANEHGLTIQNTGNFEDLQVEYNTSIIQLTQPSSQN